MQARSNKQQGKTIQHTQGNHFSRERLAAWTRTHGTLHCKQSTLPAELPEAAQLRECRYYIPYLSSPPPSVLLNTSVASV